jgi:hypothetical protein
LSLLAIWTFALARNRHRWVWLRSRTLAVVLVPLTLLTNAFAFVAIGAGPAPGTRWLATTLLWLAWVLGITTVFALRRWDDGGGEDGPDEQIPPWWPDFERQFRDYARRGPPSGHPGESARRPRAPAGV